MSQVSLVARETPLIARPASVTASRAKAFGVTSPLLHPGRSSTMRRGPPHGAAALALWMLAATAVVAAPGQDGGVLARFPHAGAGRIAFVARDQLWMVDQLGGLASRLAGGPGRITAPSISPDGRWVAFTRISGPTSDVEVIPVAGGSPRRLTFTATAGLSRGAPDNLVLGWTPDSRKVLFLSRRQSWNGWVERPYAAALAGGLPEALPLDRSGFLSLSPDGGKAVLTRELRDFAPWKRRNGGPSEGLYTLELKSGALRQITRGGPTDTSPMWVGRQIYFLSDRDANRRANIWAMNQDGGAAREVTRFVDADVAFPAYGDGVITFEEGGRLWRLDLPSKRLQPVPVTLPEDGSEPRPRQVQADRAVRILQGAQYPSILQRPDFALAPGGDRAVFSARGDIWLFDPMGSARDLTGTSGADEDHPAVSPDGRLIAYTTDRLGEHQLAVRPTDGSGAEQVLTRFARGYLYTPVWSPDGRALAVGDANHALWLARLDGSAPQRIALDPNQEIRDPAFSLDGGWLAFTTHSSAGRGAIHIYDLARRRDTLVSSPLEDDSEPAFTADGRLLIFLSHRQGQEAVADTGVDVATVRSEGLYAAVLDPRTFPFDAQGRLAPPLQVRPVIEPDGLMRRIVPLPVGPSDIAGLQVRGEQVFYETTPLTTLDGPAPEGRSELHVLDLASAHDTTLMTGLDAFSASEDGRSVLGHVGGQWRLLRTGGGEGRGLNLTAMRTVIDPRAEWREMFENAWRLARDTFPDPRLNGVDWAHVRAAYDPIVDRLGSRDDLNALLTSMLGELGSSHVRVAGGDFGQSTPLPEAALLGADFVLDSTSGRYRFARVHPGDASRPDERGPLGAPGVGIKDGDFLLAIDGLTLQAPETPFQRLAGRIGQVVLTVSRGGAKREVTVLPVEDEGALRQQDWIDHSRDEVDRLSGGRLAYVFLPDMAEAGAEQFARQFYPQDGKDGLIIDVRFNRGGYLSPLLIDHLSRATRGAFVNREGGREPLPAAVLSGPKALLINEYSTSDAENFALLFRAAGLGPLVGTRTQGAVRGVAGAWRLLDGGVIALPFSQLEDAKGRTLIENRGVDPDVAVENSPKDVLSGDDGQLRAAVRNILDRLRNADVTKGSQNGQS